jgi:hypothetical protein
MTQVGEQTKPSQLFMAYRFGIGHWYFGKGDREYDPATGMERFRTTVFVLILFFPLLPTGTYVIQKRHGFFSRKVTILKKLPIDWGQVTKVWLVALVALFAVIWLLKRV